MQLEINKRKHKADCPFDYEDGFKRGVNWADKNPKAGMVSLDRACEYLESVLEHDLGYYGAAEFADTFRKAMEE